VAGGRVDAPLRAGDAVLEVDESEVQLGLLRQAQRVQLGEEVVVVAPDRHRHVHPVHAAVDLVEHGVGQPHHRAGVARLHPVLAVAGLGVGWIPVAVVEAELDPLGHERGHAPHLGGRVVEAPGHLR
jgi:hypothetical protein